MFSALKSIAHQVADAIRGLLLCGFIALELAAFVVRYAGKVRADNIEKIAGHPIIKDPGWAVANANVGTIRYGDRTTSSGGFLFLDQLHDIADVPKFFRQACRHCRDMRNAELIRAKSHQQTECGHWRRLT